MIFSPYITLAAEFDNALAKDVCREALEILNSTYPGYSWKTKVTAGSLFILLLDRRLKGNWGMNIKLNKVNHDIAALKREVIFMAGEFLERCGVSRQGNMEELIRKVEGIPQRHQPRAA